MDNINYNKLVFVDTETVGFKPPYIISIGFIAYENGKRIGQKYLICNPDYPISESASKINGFYNSDLLDKPLFSEIWTEISYFFENSIWIAHNCAFDEKAIVQSCKRYNIVVPKHWTFCTCENAKKVLTKKDVPNFKLNTLCNYFNINLLNHHTATDDVIACLKIYNKILSLNKGELVVKDEVLL